MKKLPVIIMVTVTILIFASCQQIFTYSALEWAQRDPADLPEDQQIAYAESILTSGDTEAMAEAYEVINDLVEDNPYDVDLRLLAADLAIGGSGISDAIADLDLDDLENSVETLLADIDLDLVAASVEHIEAAAALDPDAVSEEQYLNTGLILLAQAAEEAVDDFGGLSTISDGDLGWDTLVKANNFITSGGGDITDYGVNNPNPLI